MIDNDDADFMLLASMSTGGWFSVALFVFAVFLFIGAAINEDECSEKHCDSGEPAVIKGECLCVEKAK